MTVLKACGKALRRFSIVFTAVFLTLMLTPLSNWMASPLVSGEGISRRTDLIAVLGGGAYSNGVLGAASNERLMKGVILYREGRAGKLLFAGGSVLPLGAKLGHTVLGAAGPPEGRFTEAGLMRALAASLGVPPADCLVEESSLSTFENLDNLKAYMEKEGMRSVTLVSSPLHMKRVELVSRKLGLDFTLSPALDATAHRTTPLARLHLMRDVLWEYSALALYWARGQV